MSLAHYFTFLRILLSPVFPIVYLGYEWFHLPFSAVPYIMLFLLCVCESSDLIDGYLARRCNQVTDLGKVLDPMADSITRVSLFLTFTQGPVALPLLIVLVFLYRDFCIGVLRTLCALRGVALAARISGKLKAIIQGCVLFLIVFLMILQSTGVVSLELMQKTSCFATAFAALYTLLSVIDYFYANRLYIRKALQAH